MRLRKMVGYVYYSCFARFLPASYGLFGFIGKPARALGGRLVLDKCGRDVNIERKALFSHRCELGNRSGIGVRAHLYGKVVIGDDVMMAPDVVIYTRNHETKNTTIPMNVQGSTPEEPVFIGDDVWIGGGVTILPGVSVGSHSVLAAKAVVTKDVPEWAVVGGNPAKVIKYRREI